MIPRELPSEIRFSITANGEPVAGAWVATDLAMESKNPYRFSFGPSDRHGVVTVSADDLRARARAVQDHFPQDYLDLAIGWTGRITVRPVDRPAVERLRAAFETWRHTAYYPSDFDRQLDALALTLESLAADSVLDVQAAALSSSPTSIRTEATRPGGT